MCRQLKTYAEFADYIDEIGFMPLSGNPVDYPNLSAMTAPEQWHTGLDTDPWQWRTRIVDDRRAAYAKLFRGLPSFISKDWYPLFLAVRRGGGTFDDAWDRGLMSSEARRIYELFRCRTRLATHEIKQLGGFTKQSNSKYESAMAALQMGMFITVSGMTRMTTMDGRPYSWPVTEYQRVEEWAWADTMETARRISWQDAADKITAKMQQTIPGAARSKLCTFIGI